MPIHDRGYRRYEGLRRPPGGAWRVIARAGIRRALAERRFIALLLTAWAPFLIRGVQMYVAVSFPQAAFLAPTVATMREFLDQQSLFIFLVTVYTGAGLVATDRRTQALPLYLSKPLRPADYIAGQLAVVLAFLAVVSVLPALLLLPAQGLITGELTLLHQHPWLVPAILLHSTLQILVAATTMLALSSLAGSGRFAGMVYAALAIGAAALVPLVRMAAGEEATVSLAILDAVGQLGDRLFGMQSPGAVRWPVSLLAVVAVLGTSLAVLRLRVRGVEVVA